MIELIDWWAAARVIGGLCVGSFIVGYIVRKIKPELIL